MKQGANSVASYVLWKKENSTLPYVSGAPQEKSSLHFLTEVVKPARGLALCAPPSQTTVVPFLDIEAKRILSRRL